MAQTKKENKLYSLFKNNFKVNLFYKPTMENDDVLHYIILDNTIRLSIRMHNNTVMTIHDIIPLSDAYLVKYYDKFIEFLMSQTQYTVLISRIGYTNCINESCVKLGIPVVDDTRFLSVPIRVYERLKLAADNDANKYGFYLLAVSDDTDMTDSVSDNTSIGQVKIMDKFRQHILKHGRMTEVEQLDDNRFKTSLDGVYILFTEIDNCIHILESYSPNNVSGIFYMGLYEYLEKFVDTNNIIYLDEITNGIVYNICKVRQYQKMHTEYAIKNSFGTYKITKFQ